MPSLVTIVAEAIGPAAVLTEPDDVAPYYVDWHGRYRGEALCVALPRSTGEVAAVVRLCAEAGEPVFPQGGNTGVCGGSVPLPGRRGVLLSLARMTAIRHLDASENVIIAEAGCVLADVQAAARSASRLFPLTLGAEGSCRIGGNVSTNAGGIAALRYGSMRDFILGLEVVLPDGQVWDGLGRLRKDNTGYRLRDMFVGAEGTLGVVTAAALRLFPLPHSSHVAWLGVADVEAAIRLLGHCGDAFGSDLTAFELMSGPLLDLVLARFADLRRPLPGDHPWFVLVHVAGANDSGDAGEVFETALATAMNTGLCDDGVIARSEAEVEAFWRLRHGVTEANRWHGLNITHDIGLPIGAVADFMATADAMVKRDFPEADIFSVSHLGDGNIHYTVTVPEEARASIGDPDAFAARVTAAIHDIAVGLGGTFSAEHGIGQRYRSSLKRYKSQLELDMFARLKTAFDPRGLMNPGKLMPQTDAALPGRDADSKSSNEETVIDTAV